MFAKLGRLGCIIARELSFIGRPLYSDYLEMLFWLLIEDFALFPAEAFFWLERVAPEGDLIAELKALLVPDF